MYIYRPNREADFLRDLLRDFKGVLVSDFYPGYESLPCEQQACLVHLIRDMNADLLSSPFDEEFKAIATEFGKLLRSIVGTIDKYGLKKRHLHKHKAEVARFFRDLADRVYRSELAEGYQKRLRKNEGRLFTFLDHDNIPWNNNAAEHAIKGFDRFRELNDGQMREAGLSDHLVLLSVQQTCKYRGISFLDFLLSQEEDVEAYCRRGRFRKEPDADHRGLPRRLLPDPSQDAGGSRRRGRGPVMHGAPSYRAAWPHMLRIGRRPRLSRPPGHHRGDRLGRRSGRRGGRPTVRKKLRQALLREAGQPPQHVAQIDERVVAVTLAARDHAEQDRHRLAALLTPREQPVLSSSCDRLHVLLRHVVVDRQVPRARVADQRLPVVLDVADGAVDRTLGQHVLLLLLEPLAEALQDRHRPFLADSQPNRGPHRFVGLVLGHGLGDLLLDRLLDGIELAIKRQRRGGARQIRRLRLDELPPRVRVAPDLDHAAAGVDAVVAAEGIGLEEAAITLEELTRAVPLSGSS